MRPLLVKLLRTAVAGIVDHPSPDRDRPLDVARVDVAVGEEPHLPGHHVREDACSAKVRRRGISFMRQPRVSTSSSRSLRLALICASAWGD